MEKSTQIYTIIKCQRKVLNLFISNFYRLFFRTGKNYYPQIFLKCKDVIKEKKMSKYY